MGKKVSRDQKKVVKSKELSLVRELEAKSQEIDSSACSKFSDLPLSPKTLKGLTEAGFVKMTDIQRESIGKSLQRKDILGAAKTGSGKTLAFVIPVLDLLWRERWSRYDGVGAIIISPTRELAMQTYECILKVSKYHELSSSLIIGGTSFGNEQRAITSTNIIVCTPGRLLQHMDETPEFQCLGLKLLVLDEADRILDLGFASTLNSIVANLPPERQTLLFSATQTRSVRDLARLSLKSPEYISVHEKDKLATPAQLNQAYLVCDLGQKINVLYSFIKSHLTAKIIVFVSSCKQVRFLYESFRKMRPGVPLLALYGRQKMLKRAAIFRDFTNKASAVLICTDIASRGLDFPAVNWVLQFDCPEDVDQYIHRVGRTARFDQSGSALLFLLASETPFVELLTTRKVVINKIDVNASKINDITPRLRSMCAESTELKYLAQKCFISYVRSIFLQSNKQVFDVQAIDHQAFADALGLPHAPKIKFLKKKDKVHSSAGKTPENGLSWGEGKDLKPKPAQKAPSHSSEESASDKESDEKDSEEDSDEESDGESEGSGENDSVSSRSSEESSSDDNDEDDDEKPAPLTEKKELKKNLVKTKFDKMRSRVNQDVLSESRSKLREKVEDDGEDLLVTSTTQHHVEDIPDPEPFISKRQKEKMKTVAGIKLHTLPSSTHLVFTDEGTLNVDENLVGIDVRDPKNKSLLARETKDLEEAKEYLKNEDATDKEVEKARLREKKLKRKLANRPEKPVQEEDGVQLGGFDEDHSDQEEEQEQEFDSDEENEFEEENSFDDHSFEGSDEEADLASSSLGAKRKESSDLPPQKRKKTLEDDEEMVLKLLGQ